METGGYSSATIAMIHSANNFSCVMRTQAPPSGLPPQGAFHRVFLRDPQAFHTCHGALLSRASLSLTIALSPLSYCPVFGGPAEAFSHGARGGSARALIGHGAQLPRTLLGCFGWSDSAHFPLRTEMPPGRVIIFVVQLPSHPLPPPAPASTSRVPIPLP